MSKEILNGLELPQQLLTFLGEKLINGLHAGSCSVVCTDETIFLSRREGD